MKICICCKDRKGFILSKSVLKICNFNKFSYTSCFILFFLFFFFFETNQSFAQVYFVSPSGNDTNAGNFVDPFRTIKKALSLVDGGDTIKIRGGNFTEGTLRISNKDTSPERPLFIVNYENEEVIIDHQGVRYAWFIENQSHLHIKGITIQNAQEGFVILGNSKNITIKDCTVRDMGNRGFFAHGRGYDGYPGDILISNNDFYRIGHDTAGADISLGYNVTNVTISNNTLHGNVDGIVMSGASSGHLIENNKIHSHTLEDGIDLKNVYKRTSSAISKFTIIRYNEIYGNVNQTGITIQEGSKNVKIYENNIFNNKWGIWVNDNNTSDIIIERNKIHCNSVIGIVVNMGAAGNIVIENNEISNNGYFLGLQQTAGISITAGSNYIISNNIISNNSFKNSTNKIQLIVGEKQIDSTTLKSNKYRVDNDHKIIRWGKNKYKLDEIKRYEKQDINSTISKIQHYNPCDGL